MTHLQLFNPSLARSATNPQAWRIGFWSRFPWAAVLGLLSTAIASGFMVRILLSSNNRPIDSWTYQPTVLLAITYTIANICLQFALGQAVTISWWLRALRGDATVRELHSTWAFGHGIKDILLSGRSFNLVALAGFMVTLAPINGPLLQRASVIGSRGGYDLVNVTIPIAPSLVAPYFTGLITRRSETSTNALSTMFRAVLNQHKHQESINVTKSGCIGTCKGKLLGAGYEIKCNDASDPYNIGPYTDCTIHLPFYCFSTSFNYTEKPGYPNTIYFDTRFKPLAGGKGNMAFRKCSITLATIEYPILLKNDTISLDPQGSWMTDRVTAYWPEKFAQRAPGNLPSTHGDLWLYLNTMYTSSASTNYEELYGDLYGWSLNFKGVTFLNYVDNAGEPGGCKMTIRDPTFDLMSDVREIAFRTALYLGTNSQMADKPVPQVIEVQQLWSQNVYKSQYQYLAIAVFITILASICVFLILLRWWKLGRNVTLSPIETAKAFAAPTLQDAKSNVDIDALLKTMGLRRFRYGAVWDVVEVDGDSGANLRFARTGQCERPREGQNFL